MFHVLYELFGISWLALSVMQAPQVSHFSCSSDTSVIVKFELQIQDRNWSVKDFVMELPEKWLNGKMERKHSFGSLPVLKDYFDCDIYRSCQIVSGYNRQVSYFIMDMPVEYSTQFQSSLSVWLGQSSYPSSDPETAELTCKLVKRGPSMSNIDGPTLIAGNRSGNHQLRWD